MLDRAQRLALHLVATHGVHRLRRKTNVSHDLDFGIDQALNQVSTLLAAFDFYRLGSTIFHEADRVTQAVAHAHVVRRIGHVGDQESVLHSAAYRAHVVKHLLHGDRQGVLVAQHDHAQRVAHQDDVDAGFVDQPCAGVVIRCQTGNQFVALFFFEERGGSNLLAEVARSDAHDALQCSSA